jgi:hypothetical protein
LGKEEDLGFAFGVFFLYTDDMKLVTRKEAAKTIYMSEGILSYWIKQGRLTKHPIPGKSRQYLIDLHEVKSLVGRSKRELLMKETSPDLITTNEAAKLIHVTARQISYYIRMGYIKQHFVLGNKRNYLVNREEVLAQPALVRERLVHSWRLAELRLQAGTMKRDHRGWWTKV